MFHIRVVIHFECNISLFHPRWKTETQAQIKPLRGGVGGTGARPRNSYLFVKYMFLMRLNSFKNYFIE